MIEIVTGQFANNKLSCPIGNSRARIGRGELGVQVVWSTFRNFSGITD